MQQEGVDGAVGELATGALPDWGRMLIALRVAQR
jgi:hypothetical protein